MKQSFKNYCIRGLRFSVSLLFVAMLITFSACTDEQTQNPPNGEENTISFSVKTLGGFIPTTYGLSENQENAIETIDVLIFKKDAGIFKYFSGPHYASLGTPYNEGGKTYTPVTIRIPDGVNISSADYSVEVFANSRSIINTAATGFTTAKTRSEVFGMLSVNLSTGNGKWIDATNNPQYATIPMHATLNGATAKADLVRMLARINVKNTPDAMGQFQLKSVHLYNHNTQGYVAATTAGTLNALVSSVASGLTYTTGSNTFENEIYTFEAATGSDPSVFTVGNPCLVIGGNYKGDSNKEYYYRVDFFGKKKDSTDPEAYLPLLRNHSYEVSVTKVFGPGYTDPDDAAASKPINIEYTIQGWDENSIIDAGYNGQYMVGVSASKFNFDKVARTKYSGDNILYIQTDHPSGWTAEISGDGGGTWLKLLDIKTGNEITSSAGLTDSYTFSTSTASPVKLQLEANTGTGSRSATIKLKAGNVVCSVAVTQSDQATVYTTFQPESNCYIVKPDSKIFIPVSRANGSPEIGIQLKQADAFEVELIWAEDASIVKSLDVYGTGSNGYVYVETGSMIDGNATVGIRKQGAGENDGFLWSWHIWVTDYNPDATSPASGYFMDRNLGALNNGFENNDKTGTLSPNAKTAGLLYQWGRKDPFPGTNDYTKNGTSGVEPDLYSPTPSYLSSNKLKIVNTSNITTESTYTNVTGSPQNLCYSIANPHIYYTASSDWYTSSSPSVSRNDNLWGGASGSKTVYDPCPPGWRVPNNNLWLPAVNNSTANWLSYSGKGWVWGSKGCTVTEVANGWVGPQIAGTYFPASGFRYSSGSFFHVGSYGYYWSASPINSYDRYLSFTGSVLLSPGSSSSNANRASGLSLRCSKNSSE